MLFLLVGAAGLALVGVCLFALASPSLLARLYGLPVDGAASLGWVRAAGLRDGCLGLVIVGAACLHDTRVATLAVGGSLALPIGDVLIAFFVGGKRPKPAHLNHVAGAVAFGALLVALLRS